MAVRVLIVADIHANLEAFRAVLEDAGRGGPIDQVWCLGDVVGYGPDPGACVELLASLPHLAVAGNHDLAAVGSIGLERFNPYAAQAVRWTAAQLTERQKAYLASLPRRRQVPPFTLVHGSPLDPVWDYVLPEMMPEDRLREAFLALPTPYGLVGQSHVPLVCHEKDLRFRLLTGDEVLMPGNERLIGNPGSVGQPRDGDPRASYLLYIDEGKPGQQRLNHRRVTYDLKGTQDKIRRAGLPWRLAARLQYGV